MTARTLDAATVAQRMNARPLGPDVDGGGWEEFVSDVNTNCDQCGAVLRHGVMSDTDTLCLTCAVADCERAEAEHRASDPHCTCNDCIHYLAAHLED